MNESKKTVNQASYKLSYIGYLQDTLSVQNILPIKRVV